MWMVQGNYNVNDAEFNNMPVSASAAADYGGRKLRPLMPRPLTTSSSSSSPNNNTVTPSLTRIPNDFFSHQYLGGSVGEQGKRSSELNNSAAAAAVVVSSRWNPTPEQLRALEELYRRGTRTPSAEQIQQITAQLRRFGKIEGKNVFYWFQNHKARERQKRRRQMESAADADLTLPSPSRDFLIDRGGASSRSMTVCEVEETNKYWAAPSTNCTAPEESVSIQQQEQERAAAAAAAAKATVADHQCRTDGWAQFDEFGSSELQQRRNFMERNATWHMMQLSCPPIPHLLNNYNTTPPPPNPNTSTTVATTTTTILSTSTTVTSNANLVDPNKLIKTHDLSFFISPHTQNGAYNIHVTTNFNSQDDHPINNSQVQSQTLQLFPIRNLDDTSTDDMNQHKETDLSASAMNAPSQFFEFLPLKN